MKQFCLGLLAATLLFCTIQIVANRHELFRSPTEIEQEADFKAALSQCRTGRIDDWSLREVGNNASFDPYILKKYHASEVEIDNYRLRGDVKSVNAAYMRCKSGKISSVDLSTLWFAVAHQRHPNVLLTDVLFTKDEVIEFTKRYNSK